MCLAVTLELKATKSQATSQWGTSNKSNADSRKDTVFKPFTPLDALRVVVREHDLAAAECAALVNPKLGDDFHYLCTGGVVLKVAPGRSRAEARMAAGR